LISITTGSGITADTWNGKKRGLELRMGIATVDGPPLTEFYGPSKDTISDIADPLETPRGVRFIGVSSAQLGSDRRSFSELHPDADACGIHNASDP
jgi:hypothetical protein